MHHSLAVNLSRHFALIAIGVLTHSLLHPSANAAPPAVGPATASEIRKTYATFAKAVANSDWLAIRKWYETRLATDYSATNGAGRHSNKATVLSQLPEPDPQAAAHSDGPKAHYSLIITAISASAPNQLTVTTREVTRTTIHDDLGQFGKKGAAHAWATANLGRDTWQKRAGKWLETQHTVTASQSLLDGKLFQQTAAQAH